MEATGKTLTKALKIYKEKYGYKINLDIDINTLNEIIKEVGNGSNTITS